MNDNKKKSKLDLVIVILAMLMLLMGVGYSILSTRLYIIGTAKIAGKWKITIESVEALENNTSAVSTKAAVVNSSTVDFATELTKPGDYMEYNIVVKNEGNIEAKLQSIIDSVQDETEYIKFSNNAVLDEVLKPGEKTQITVRVEFPIESEELVQVSSSYKLTLNYVQN